MNENNWNAQEIILIHFGSTFSEYFQNTKDCEWVTLWAEA